MSNLQHELKSWLSSNSSWSQTKVAQKLALSGGALSSWLNGKYKGDVSKIDKAVSAFLEGQKVAQEDRNTFANDFEFCETSVYLKIEEDADLAEHRGEMRVVTGLSGIGKTTALKHIQEQRTGMLLIECYQGMNKQTILRQICRQLGVDTKGTYSVLFDRVTDNLIGSHRLIAIDEAEHLSFTTIDTIRRVHDFTGCGVLMVGHPRFYRELKSNQRDYAYLYNRLSLPLHLETLKKDDIKQLVKTVFDTDMNFDTFFTACGGIGRDLKIVVRESMRVAKINHIEYSDSKFGQIVNTVAKHLGRAQQYA